MTYKESVLSADGGPPHSLVTRCNTNIHYPHNITIHTKNVHCDQFVLVMNLMRYIYNMIVINYMNKLQFNHPLKVSHIDGHESKPANSNFLIFF